MFQKHLYKALGKIKGKCSGTDRAMFLIFKFYLIKNNFQINKYKLKKYVAVDSKVNMELKYHFENSVKDIHDFLQTAKYNLPLKIDA